MKIEINYVPVQEIVPYEKNPRKNDKAVEIVAKSIQEFGFNVPILLDKGNKIIAGHTRLKAAMQLGLTEVPVIWLENLTEEQVKAFRIMDNKSMEYSDWDFSLLKDEFKDLKDMDYDLSLTGFSENEINKIFPQNAEEGELPDPEKPKYEVQLGDIYQLGTHRLMCGDCTQNTDKLFNGTKANMILTDPPYGVDYANKNAYLIKIGKPNRIETPITNDKDINIRELLAACLKNAQLTEKNTLYVFTRGKHIADMIYAFEDANCNYCQDLKWVKNNHVLGRLDYHPQSENILYGWKGTHEFYGGFRTDVLKYDKPLVSDLHPTMKPLQLLMQLISDGSQENTIIYDGFGGSGSTLIACEKMNRICYMMEIDPRYCSVIIERFENLTGKKAIKLNETLQI